MGGGFLMWLSFGYSVSICLSIHNLGGVWSSEQVASSTIVCWATLSPIVAAVSFDVSDVIFFHASIL